MRILQKREENPAVFLLFSHFIVVTLQSQNSRDRNVNVIKMKLHGKNGIYKHRK